MINIFEQLLYTTLKIECIDLLGNITSIGTGFLLSRPIDINSQKIYLVTNKHVIEGQNNISISFTELENGEPKIGRIQKFNISELQQGIVYHPDKNIDIAILEITGLFINFPNKLFFKTVDYDMLATFKEEELNVAQSIYFVGYPDNRYDIANNLPLIRTGIIASNPKLDFNGSKQFIIDAQVFPDSSGSPVYIDLIYENFKNGQIVLGERKVKLLGIVAMTMIRNNELQAINTNTKFITQEVLGLGIVFKSTAIKELIDSMPTNN